MKTHDEIGEGIESSTDLKRANQAQRERERERKRKRKRKRKSEKGGKERKR